MSFKLDKKRALFLFALSIGVLGLSELSVPGYDLRILSKIGFSAALLLLIWMWLLQN